jgi:hypothetical protein
MDVIAHDADDQSVEQRQGASHNRIVPNGKGIETPHEYSCSLHFFHL